MIGLLIALLAANGPPTQKPRSPTAREDVVVTAERVPEPRESVPAAVSVLTREQIERLPAENLAELLRFLPGFHVHFAAISPTLTSVSVTALDTEVLNGQMTGMIGHGRANRYVRVEATSLEEYMVLRYIGNILGVRSMPEVILPAP